MSLFDAAPGIVYVSVDFRTVLSFDVPSAFINTMSISDSRILCDYYSHIVTEMQSL
jgi:hypothetical protein